MRVELSDEELNELERILENYSADLVNEIQHTDNYEFRDELRRERNVVALLQHRMRHPEEKPTEQH